MGDIKEISKERRNMWEILKRLVKKGEICGRY